MAFSATSSPFAEKRISDRFVSGHDFSRAANVENMIGL